jgi:hypothetical protein
MNPAGQVAVATTVPPGYLPVGLGYLDPYYAYPTPTGYMPIVPQVTPASVAAAPSAIVFPAAQAATSSAGLSLPVWLLIGAAALGGGYYLYSRSRGSSSRGSSGEAMLPASPARHRASRSHRSSRSRSAMND